MRKVELSELGKHLGIFDFPALAEEQTDEVFPQHEENTSQNEAEHKTMKEEIEKLKSQAETK